MALSTQTVAPFDRYVGLKLPKGDAARDMLLTDTQHTVELASLDREGKPVSIPRLQVTLYKVEWRWWWESAETRSVTGRISCAARLPCPDARGQWRQTS